MKNFRRPFAKKSDNLWRVLSVMQGDFWDSLFIKINDHLQSLKPSSPASWEKGKVQCQVGNLGIKVGSEVPTCYYL